MFVGTTAVAVLCLCFISEFSMTNAAALLLQFTERTAVRPVKTLHLICVSSLRMFSLSLSLFPFSGFPFHFAFIRSCMASFCSITICFPS